MVSERQIKEMTAMNAKVMKTENLFRSKAMNRYFQELANIALVKEIQRYNKIHLKEYSRKTKTKVIIDYNPKNKNVAYAASSTNNKTGEETIKIYINIGHVMFAKVLEREKLLLMAKGLLAHEISHIINTDYRELSAFRTRIDLGRICPDVDEKDMDSRPADFQMNFDKMIHYIEGPKENRQTFATMAAELHNCGEDGFIEEATMAVNSGSMIEGLFELRDFDFDHMPTLEEMTARINLDDEHPEHMHIFDALSQTYLCYAKYGEFKYEDEDILKNSEIIQAFIPCIKDLDKALASKNTKARMRYMNNTIVLMWPYIESYLEYIDSLPDSDDEGDGDGEEGSGSSSKASRRMKKHMKGSSSTNEDMKTPGTDSKESGDEDVSKKRKATKSKLGLPEDEDENEEESSEGNSEDEESSEDNSMSVSDKEGGRIDEDKAEDIVKEYDETDSTTDFNNDYEGNGYDDAAKDIEKILNEVSREEAEKSLEKTRSDELNTFGRSINYGDKHRRMSVKVNRMSVVPDSLIDAYDTIAAPLIKISKQLQRKVSQKLKDRRRGGKNTNLYFGHRLEVRTLIRNDGRCFSNSKAPNREPRICVAGLLDESGSMCWNQRCTYARATGLILYDFCSGLDIPCSIYGHSADEHKSGGLDMYSYAEFDSIDKKDRYRIMDVSARSNNRDGAALTYMYKMLEKRTEDVKLLFIVSDGQPFASGYSGKSAEEDMKTLVESYRRKGIITIAAAIGDDKEAIEHIYGSDCFLDVSNLDNLPVVMTNIIIKNLKL